MPEQGLPDGRGDQVAGRVGAVAVVVFGIADAGVVDEPDRFIDDVVPPTGRNHAMRRGHRSRGERGQRYGGRSLLIVVGTFREAGAALCQTQKSARAELAPVTVDVVRTHGAYD